MDVQKIIENVSAEIDTIESLHERIDFDSDTLKYFEDLMTPVRIRLDFILNNILPKIHAAIPIIEINKLNSLFQTNGNGALQNIRTTIVQILEIDKRKEDAAEILKTSNDVLKSAIQDIVTNISEYLSVVNTDHSLKEIHAYVEDAKGLLNSTLSSLSEKGSSGAETSFTNGAVKQYRWGLAWSGIVAILFSFMLSTALGGADNILIKDKPAPIVDATVKKNKKEKLSRVEVIQYKTITLEQIWLYRVSLIIVLIIMATWFSRNARASFHQSAHFRQKALAIEAIPYIINTVSKDNITARETIYTIAAHSIFSEPQSGYISDKNQLDTPLSKIIDLLQKNK